MMQGFWDFSLIIGGDTLSLPYQVIRIMLDVVLITAGLIALAVVLLSVRLLCGKRRFVQTHIDGNKALNRKGIFCAKEQDRAQRRHNGLVIREKKY